MCCVCSWHCVRWVQLSARVRSHCARAVQIICKYCARVRRRCASTERALRKRKCCAGIAHRTVREVVGKAGRDRAVDQEHEDVKLQQLEFEEIKGATTLATREEQTELRTIEFEDRCPMDAGGYPMAVVRINYLVMDRPDHQLASKEVGKYIARMQIHHWQIPHSIPQHLTCPSSCSSSIG